MCAINDGTDGGCPKCNPEFARAMRMTSAEFAEWNLARTVKLRGAMRSSATNAAPAPPDFVAAFKPSQSDRDKRLDEALRPQPAK